VTQRSGWATRRPGGSKTAAKYRTREHVRTRAAHMAALRQAGTGRCAEIRCLYGSRLITPDMDLHLCHDRRTGAVLGLGHAACNRSEAARYARAQQHTISLRL
jgi:hypothetical protein